MKIINHFIIFAKFSKTAALYDLCAATFIPNS